MTKKNSQIVDPQPQPSSHSGPDAWSYAALLIATLVVLPILAVFWIALTPKVNIWPHLIATTLPRYLSNTAILAVSVGGLSAVTGTLSAWMVTIYRFPGSRALQWLLLLPMAIPAYIGAYALVDFLEYAGPVQTELRVVFGWQSARDYWFPEVRSRGMAILVLTAALSPYVFLMARAAFKEQSGRTFEVARALGAGPMARFWRVGLPLARPAIAAATAIVVMETVSDYGAVSYFAVQTLTTGIFSTWLDAGNAGGAAQIASLILIVALFLTLAERQSRLRRRYSSAGRIPSAIVPIPLNGWRAGLALVLCTIPFLLGFVLPGGVILSHALANAGRWLDPGLVRALLNTLTVGGLAAGLTVAAALCLTYGARLSRSSIVRLMLPATTIGYAAPGAVLGIGLLIPLAGLDHAIADTLEAVTGRPMPLILTGSAFAIIYAYAVRFFAIAQGTVDGALGRVPGSLALASRSLGQTARGTLFRVYLPMIRGSLGTALLLVFVDCVKELPATLLLRPFNFNTLSTRVYEHASLENISDAAPAAMLVIAVGLLAVLLLARGSGATR